ncbi:MAG: transposase zinc-binding domain-containing protein [Thermodesulfobacteriota bacterium]|nr:transposase zinc-binding domain-containing protein [Thermodesulfobacteriota bacterium]
MIGCGDPSNGYAEYVCPQCGNKKQVPFTCKSRFCTSF